MKIDNRIWIILTVFVSVAVLAGAWFLGVSPFLAAAANSAIDTAQVAAANAKTANDITALKAAKAKLPELEAGLTALQSAVPTSVQGTALITEFDSISGSTGASVGSITIGDPVAYTSPAPVAAAPAASTSGSSATPAPTASASATATTAPVATGPAAPSIVTDSRITGSNFLVVPVSVTVKGTADQTAAFLHGVQYGSRLVLVTGLTRSTDTDGVTLVITGSAYVLSDTASSTTTTTTTSAAGTNG